MEEGVDDFHHRLLDSIMDDDAQEVLQLRRDIDVLEKHLAGKSGHSEDDDGLFCFSLPSHIPSIMHSFLCPPIHSCVPCSVWNVNLTQKPSCCSHFDV
jgi:hypothetical protein